MSPFLASRIISLFFFCASLCITTEISTVQSQINVWPKPRNISWPHPQATTLSPTFTIIVSPPLNNHPYLSLAVARYHILILTEHYSPIVSPSVNLTATTLPLQFLTLSVTNPSVPLQHGVDESYTLTIPNVGSSANLTAATVWGAMRGLETFSQLVWGNPPRVAMGLDIWDAPLFGHRGVLLDTARNYYGVADILRTIQAMSYNKLNVFHWHITDSQSFPLVLPSEPELAGKGSYGPRMQYSPEDVKMIVEFGLENGVRVMPEIDAPGHTGSWAKAYPEIVTCANMFWTGPSGTAYADRLASEPGTGQLNPLNPKTYQVLKNVIHDVVALFPERFYHGGADEIVPGCWKADPTIQNYLSQGGNLNQLLQNFINTTLPYITSLNRTVVYWEDVLFDATMNVSSSILPPEKVIMQTWNNGPNNTLRLVSAGYRVIVSSADFYYLDCGHGGWLGDDSRYDLQVGDLPGQPFNYAGGNGGSWCDPFKTWQRVYDYDITYGLNETQGKLVLGGEVALWSEQADSTVLDGKIWPRTSAMAETMWSGNRDETGKKRYAEAINRLNEWRYRMVYRGIGAEPLQPLWCITHPGMCNLVQ
ncbi:beta-hexosaminidase 2-like [Telopea speciosissima]|uniref:beta-hexosaminidase 2-like n=1 Tax=Telopea speciosissima TaxID=54955 RepID=UPI001CC50144|nr:beta-hexosaminidase 2-like [Telopea speciosissima]